MFPLGRRRMVEGTADTLLKQKKLIPKFLRAGRLMGPATERSCSFYA